MFGTALQYLLDHSLTLPFECCDCPFATVDSRYDLPNPADPGEGHYVCSLLTRTVWGESPECTADDWIALARAQSSA